jgi:Zn-dependent metalloprotease
MYGSQTIAPAQTPYFIAQQIQEWLRSQLEVQQAAQQAASSNAVAQRKAKLASVRRLESIAGGKVKLAFHENGTPSEIKGGLLEAALVGALIAGVDRHEETARNFLRANRELLLLADPDQELKLAKTEGDNLGRRHLLFQQVYKGLPVWPCYLAVHQDKDGNVDVMDGAFVPTPLGVNTEPSVTAEKATLRAKEQVDNGAAGEATSPELVIYGPLNERPKLAWKFDLNVDVRHAWRCVVDASDGSLLSVHNLVLDEAVTGSGVDAAGAARMLHVWHQGSTYYTVDTSKAMYNPASTPPVYSNTFGAIFVFDAQNQPPTSNPTALPSAVLGASTSPNSGWVPDVVGAAFGLSEVYDYYQTRHSRNSIDGAGGSISAIVRYGINFPNAFWNGQVKLMFFGDGYTAAEDVCGHEMTHGVVNTISDGQGLAAGNQPGALNEALADIFGESVQARTRGSDTWIMGADVIPGGIRDMADPSLIPQGGNASPSKMSQFVQLPDTSQGDYGGVHVNSTIISHCFYLLVHGLNAPITHQDGERIFYRALTVHMQPQTQFIDVRHACVTSAEELFGTNSTQTVATGQAFDAVELVDAPATPDPSPTAPVSAADSTLFLRWAPFYSEYEVYRREAAQGDSSAGTSLYLGKFPDYKKISVSGNGSLAYFIAADHDYGAFNTDGSGYTLAYQPGTLWSLAVTPDGKHFAGVLMDAFGYATKNLFLYDNTTSTSKVIPLYAPSNDGKPLDIIQYADTMDFTSDGRFLIYDAFAQVSTNGVFVGEWTMFKLEVATTNITQLITLNPRYDFGNPSLGKTRNNLLTFEVRDNQTGISTYEAVDLFSGDSNAIGHNTEVGWLGFPEYAGNDQAIHFSQYDITANSDSSLYRQPLASDGLTASGAPTLWISDADMVAMYRRGTFVSSNALPVVTVTTPTNGQVFAPSAPINMQVTATDADNSVASVEFYLGSTKLYTLTSAPYNITITSGLAAGTYYLSARAIDVLGGATDSKQVAITVTGSPQFSNPVRLNASTFQFTLSGAAGSTYLIQTSSDLVNWSTLRTVSNVTGTVNVQDAIVTGPARRFYRALLQ